MAELNAEIKGISDYLRKRFFADEVPDDECDEEARCIYEMLQDIRIPQSLFEKLMEAKGEDEELADFIKRLLIEHEGLERFRKAHDSVK